MAKAVLLLLAALSSLSLVTLSQADPRNNTTNIRGAIKLSGKPLTAGRVFFHTKNDQFVGAYLRKDGSFQIDNVVPGEYRVTMESSNEQQPLPAKYASKQTSGLIADIDDEGVNRFLFHLRL